MSAGILNQGLKVRTIAITRLHFAGLSSVCVACKELGVQSISLVDQIADISTKDLRALHFKALRTKLTVVPIPINLRGIIGDKIR